MCYCISSGYGHTAWLEKKQKNIVQLLGLLLLFVVVIKAALT